MCGIVGVASSSAISEQTARDIGRGDFGDAVSQIGDSFSLALKDTEKNVAEAWNELVGLFGFGKDPKKDGATSE